MSAVFADLVTEGHGVVEHVVVGGVVGDEGLVEAGDGLGEPGLLFVFGFAGADGSSGSGDRLVSVASFTIRRSCRLSLDRR